MMKDLTERKLVYLDDAIEAINKYFARIGKLKRGGLTILERAIKSDTLDAIKALPPAQQWIPCSERLPEDEYVLISKKPTKISGSKWSVAIAIRTADPRSRKIQWRDSGFGVIQDDKVLAWMPLPAPFKAERREDGKTN